MDGYRGSESRTSSETSEVTAYKSGELAQQDSPVIASMASEWTDEKHNLYLKSMEASFVNQLHNSMDLLGWRSLKEGSDPNLSKEVNCRTCTRSGQFKVHRRWNWQKINFRRPESQISSAKESRGFLTSPWIQHFTSARKSEHVASPTLQERANQSRATISNGRKAMLCCPATSSKHCHLSNSFSSTHDLVDSNTEMSDQNFVDEDIKSEKASSNSLSSKQMKTLKTDASSSDQVVPHSKPPVAEDVTKECISAAK
ncbi:COLD REGULATED PROTEIN 27 [Salix koriyanagi]|uniref:COLD REGULATED PROTEIN 27 n=1 Tax=Salix koriyanagi TaxID=2511006 RepID=A0A9Q0U2T6_9ROSI|nr:COLD REGULATED PROTEIN 27 [Salix koriyanagi]